LRLAIAKSHVPIAIATRDAIVETVIGAAQDTGLLSVRAAPGAAS
jgi:hypothetical protein